jgi:putative phosphonate catabolism associated alcohol dehydrogenase
VTSLAAVFRTPGQPFTLDPFPLPTLITTEALVRIRCCTICGSDLHSCSGRRHAPAPSILGHEMVGDLIAAGPDGARDWQSRPLPLGTRVTWSMVWSCGECSYCRRGLQPKCERLFKFGHERILPERALFGGMAEHCWLPAGTAIFPIPESLPDSVAAPANCATATVAAVFRHTGPVDGQTLVVLGAGMLGLTACAMAADLGAARVIAVEPDPRRRDLALRFGAVAAVPPSEIAALVHDQADAVLELSGHAESVELGLSLLQPGGRLTLAGSTFPDRPAQLSAEQIVRRLIRISGVYNYAPVDLDAALLFLDRVAARFPFADLVSASFPLRDVNRAIAFAETERPPRVALIP